MLVKIKTFLYNKQTGGSMEKYSFHNLNPYKNTIYKDLSKSKIPSTRSCNP